MAVDLVVSVVMKIGGYLVAPVGRQFGYLIYYERNVENLKKQVRKLEDKRCDIQIEVDAAKSNSDSIKPTVEEWLTNVNKLNEEVTKFLEQEVKANKGCLNGWCPNLNSRYSLSRKATKKTQDVVELWGDGDFSRVSYPEPPVGMASTSTGGFKSFESRRSIINEVMKSLADENINMIGICGMGGVGKTTMVKEVVKRAKEGKMFDKVVISTVSQSPEMKKIQGEIADLLEFKLEEETELGRACRLCAKLKTIKRILVILDDVWSSLELNDIEIPFGDDHKGCKILLTSRFDYVCDDMGAQKKFKVEVLTKKEAWNLFKEMAGISDDPSNTTDFHSTQMEVANECGGLPIAIVTVGRALRDKVQSTWDYALRQLRKSIVKNIRGVDEKVFKSLELSYNYLESNEAQKFFLLCSLYPEDFDIPIEDLVRYGFGLELFEGIERVGEARDRVYDLIDYLKKCYMLMDTWTEERVKMHDVVRDVAKSIASREEYSFMVRCDEVLKEWPEKDRSKNCSVISLKLNGMHGLPGNLEFPNLQLLQLDFNAGLPQISYDLNEGMEDVKVQETPESFYQGMKELRVLKLSYMYGSLPTSLGCLTNLQTLSLFYCRLIDDNVSAIGALENLEILSFADSRIKELPKELIGHLGHLKVLDLLSCKVERIYPGVLSSLSKLEELYIGCSFQSWCEVEESKETAKAIIDELASLPNLKALDIDVLNINFWPRGLVVEKLKKFKICVGSKFHYFFHNPRYQFSNELMLEVLNMSDIIETGLNKLLKSTRFLSLKIVDGFKNLFYDLVMNGDGFECLTELCLDRCHNLEYLINTTVEVPQGAFPVLESLNLINLHNFKGIISHDCRLHNKAFSALKELGLHSLPKLIHLWKGPSQLVWLGNLTSLCVSACNKLESVFSLSIARNLMHLGDISITQCDMMEEIVSSEGGEHEIATIEKIELPKLRVLRLEILPNFIAICKAMNAIEPPQLSSSKLKNIPKLKSLFPTSNSESNYDSIIQPLFSNKNLKQLLVEACPSVRVAFDLEGLVDREGMSNIAFPSLEWVKLTHLPKLTHVWKERGNSPGIQGFQNLRSLIVKGCDSLTNLFSSSLAKLLVKLQEMEVAECDAMEAVFANESKADDGVTTNVIMFPQLNSLKLSDLPNLKSFCSKAYTFEGSLLKSVEVINCPNMKALPSAFQRKLEQQRSNQEAFQKPDFSTPGQYICNVDGKLFLSLGGKHTFTEIDEPTEILKVGQGQFDLTGFMMVRNCGKLLSVVSSNLMQELKILKGLEVWYCDSLEVIFDFEEVSATTATAEEFGTSIPPPFSNLDLKYLPKLTHIWKIFPQQIQCFQNLRNLRVERCDSLRYIFTFSMAKALVNLKYLTIAQCHNLEKIITKEDEGGEDEERGKIKITSINLEDLPSLVCIGIPNFQIDINFLNANSCPKFRGWNPNSAPGGVPTVDRQL